MGLKLITEDNFNVKWEETENKNLYIEGVFSSAEVMNENGRKYKKQILSREVDKYLQFVENKCAWGELSHPASPAINPDRIAILVESLSWDNNDVIGKAKVLDTPMGNIARTLIREGKVGISSRGLGTVSETDNYVNDDYNLVCWDLITNPSNPTSWMKGIYEGQEFHIIGSKPKEETSIPVVDPQIQLKEAKNAYYKHIWQVIEQIEGNI
ncbi:MAG: hypothetical protein WC346_13255 [Methanogenium sp.]|jgi:hypothetical protein